ncbi:hypothetical protein H2248_006257 [Termitomyces sp. 'cryptogamus']|nr:hypothetical protein H2248_006257 [Termitomyces sp. 'cryptogamus']
MTDIPEEEQWRLINKSGVLKKLKTAPEPRMEDMKTLDPLAEEILNATLYIIPISFLLLLMEMCVFIVVLSQLLIAMSSLIHFQYGKHPTLNTLVDRMVPGVPSTLLFLTWQYILTFFQSFHYLYSIVCEALCTRRRLYVPCSDALQIISEDTSISFLSGNFLRQ